MCLLAVMKERKMTDDEIAISNSGNIHGIGLAWSDGEKVHAKKGLRLPEFKKLYADLEYIPHVVHFRLSSAGTTTSELTHPFIISNESPEFTEYVGTESLIFQNGTVSNWKNMMWNYCTGFGVKVPEGQFNDTRAVAMMVYGMGVNVLNFVEGGRWVILRPNGIEMYGDFINHDGAYFSNIGFKEYIYKPKNSKMLTEVQMRESNEKIVEMFGGYKERM